jgi:hypothetical protein
MSHSKYAMPAEYPVLLAVSLVIEITIRLAVALGPMPRPGFRIASGRPAPSATRVPRR